MIKKAIAAFVFVFTVIVTAGCGDSATDISYATVVNPDGISGNDIAAKAWTGTADFAGKKGKKAGLFISQNTDESSCEAALNAAAKAGAGIIVSVGTDMEVPVYQASGSQGKKKFILIGGSTRQSVDAQDSIRDNTICIAFASEQEGFLAGYGAVTEGYTNLAFMAGIKSDDAVKYEAGFIQGAEAAASDLAKGAGSVTITQKFSGSDILTPERMEDALLLYDSGCEVIMTYGANIRKAVVQAAKLRGKYVISAGEDARAESSQIIMGTTYDCESAVAEALNAADSDDFKGGMCASYGAGEKCIGLSADFTSFKSFTEDIYKAEFQKLADGSVSVSDKEQTVGTNEVSINTG